MTVERINDEGADVVWFDGNQLLHSAFIRMSALKRATK